MKSYFMAEMVELNDLCDVIGTFDEVKSLQNREKPLNNRITKEVKNYEF